MCNEAYNYYRLVFKSLHRKDGSTYAKPSFRLELPSNTFGTSGSGMVKVVLESFKGYGQTQLKIDEGVNVHIFGSSASNIVETTAVNNFSPGSLLGTALALTTKSNATFFSYDQGFMDKGAIFPANLFKQGTIQFDLHYEENDVPFVEPTDADLRFYSITLGVYVPLS